MRHGNVSRLLRAALLAGVLAVAAAKPSYSAEQGAQADGPIASFAVAAEILNGVAPLKSKAAAVPMLEAVARRGDARAQVLLGAVLLQGKYVPSDPIAGYAWLQIGAASGDGPFDATTKDKANELMRQVEPFLSGSDLIKADQISQRFLAERTKRLEDGVAQAALFYVGELPTAPDLAAFARDPVTVLPLLADTADKRFAFGCASQPDLSGCEEAAQVPPAERCLGVIPRSIEPSSTAADPNVRKPRFRYPDSLRRKQLDGDVWLVAHVDRSGWICSLRLAVSSGVPGLDDAAMLGMRRWRLSPSLRDGVPVDALRVVGVSFGIEGQEFEK